jgi:hypothetical protein
MSDWPISLNLILLEEVFLYSHFLVTHLIDLTSGSALYNWETDKHILYAEAEDSMLGGEPDIRLLIETKSEGIDDDNSAEEVEEENQSDDDLAEDLKVFKSKKFFK